MNEVLKTTFSLSCSGTLMIVLICLLRPLVRMRLSKQWQYYIWLVVVARLLIPFAPEINLIGMLFQQIDHEIAQAELAPRPYAAPDKAPVIAVLPSDAEAENQAPALGDATDYAKFSQVWSVLCQYMWLLWLVIALVLLIRKITIYQSFVKYIRAGCVEVDDIELLEQFGSLLAQNGVKTAVDLSINPMISSPLLIGFFRPRIVLPTTELSDSDFLFTILHELTHFKHRDMFYKWLVQAAICIHWFSPFSYLMGHEVERACELACDEAVIRNFDIAGRRAYGDTLMNAISAGGHYKDSVAAVTLCEGKALMVERFAAIKGFQKKPKSVCAFSFVLTGAICLGAVSVGAYSTPPMSHSPAEPCSIVELTLGEPDNILGGPNVTIAVTTQTDDITLVRGGNTLQVEYYAQIPDNNHFKLMNPLSKGNWNGLDIEFFAQNPVEYQVQPIASDDIQEMKMLSIGCSNSTGTGEKQSIKVTVPDQLTLNELLISTTSGNIQITDCMARNISTRTQNGQINMKGGAASERFSVNPVFGNALISQTGLPMNSTSNFETESGSILFHPKDSTNHYGILVNCGENAEVVIDGISKLIAQKNPFTINKGAAAKIKFTSLSGSFIMQGY